MLSSQHAKEKEINREYFLNILSIIRLLARQGLPLRGDADERFELPSANVTSR